MAETDLVPSLLILLLLLIIRQSASRLLGAWLFTGQ